MPQLDWLDDVHEVYDASVERWDRNERRLRGGDYVTDELRKFLWETEETDGTATSLPDGSMPGDHYNARKSQAVYVNFPEMFVLAMKGHLHRNRPIPDNGLSFGSLGQVRRERNFRQPTRAEQVYYNADGVGNDGSQWDNFWLNVWGRASATGHRWVFVEASRERPGNRLREIQGFRPYLVEYSPQQVTNWHFEDGRLAWAVVRITVRNPVVDAEGTMQGNEDQEGYLLLVREGHANLGEEFVGGGWWKFDGDKVLTDHGDWSRTQGEIPMWPLFYERDTGVKSNDDEHESMPAISRAGITELGQAAVAYMNLASAAEYDAWDAASSLRFLLGVDRDGYNVAADVWNSGSQIVPVPSNSNGQIPQVQDGSVGTVASDVFDKLLTRKRLEAEKIAAQEAIGSPDSSGEAKKVGFGDTRAPRLANIASEIEQAQNIAIYFLELRWGAGAPSGSVVWPREFDVIDVVEDIQAFFNLETTTGYQSPTLGSKLMVRAATEKGFITDDAESKIIESEYKDSVQLSVDTKKAAIVPPAGAPAAGTAAAPPPPTPAGAT
jgi:hypothetical protein